MIDTLLAIFWLIACVGFWSWFYALKRYERRLHELHDLLRDADNDNNEYAAVLDGYADSLLGWHTSLMKLSDSLREGR